MKKITIIRTLMVAGLVGLVAIPTIASARQGADNPAGHVRQGDRRANRHNDGQENKVIPSTVSTATSPSNDDVLVNGIKVETEATLPDGSITLEEARAIAQGQRPDATIFKVEIEVEEGIVVYSFRFTDDGRVDVRASDGTVTRVRSGDSPSTPVDTSDDDEDEDDDSDDRDDDEDEDRDDDSDDDNSGNSGRHGSNSGRH